MPSKKSLKNNINGEAKLYIDNNNKHAVFSASGSKRWLSCPGSIQAEALAPPSRDNSASVKGSAAHAFSEGCLLLGIPPMKANVKQVFAHLRLLAGSANFGATREKINKELADLRIYEPLVDDEMREGCQFYFDTVMAAMKPGSTLSVETKFDLSWVHPGMFGTNDTMIVEPWADLWILDLKYGFTPVQAEDNSQLAYYGLGAAQEVGWDFARIHMCIVQPRAKVRFSKWTLEPHELKKWVHTFSEGVDRAESDDAELIAGDHCHYCRAKATCSAQRDQVKAIAKLQFETPVKQSTPLVSKMSVDQIANVLDHRQMIEGWLSSVAAHAQHLSENGEEIPGYKLVAKRGQRIWNDPTTVMNKAYKLLGDQCFAPAKLLTPAKLEKVSRKAKTFVADNAVMFSSGKVLRKLNDERTAIEVSHDDAFDDCENTETGEF